MQKYKNTNIQKSKQTKIQNCMQLDGERDAASVTAPQLHKQLQRQNHIGCTCFSTVRLKMFGFHMFPVITLQIAAKAKSHCIGCTCFFIVRFQMCCFHIVTSYHTANNCQGKATLVALVWLHCACSNVLLSYCYLTTNSCKGKLPIKCESHWNNNTYILIVQNSADSAFQPLRKKCVNRDYKIL